VSQDQAPAPDESGGRPCPGFPEGKAWHERCSRALLFALADYQVMAYAEITDLTIGQLQQLVKAASFIRQSAVDELRERPL
jgi:hypothetical protein